MTIKPEEIASLIDALNKTESAPVVAYMDLGALRYIAAGQGRIREDVRAFVNNTELPDSTGIMLTADKIALM